MSLEEDIVEEYKKHGSVFKAARKLGITNIEVVKKAVDQMEKTDSPPDLSECRFGGYGDPNKEEFLVARNLAKESWDNTRPEVSQARKDYEAGTHDMATGRDGPWLLLYSFPRAVVKPRPDYFTLRVEG